MPYKRGFILTKCKVYENRLKSENLTHPSYPAKRKMGMKPSKLRDLWTSTWGSKAALKKRPVYPIWVGFMGPWDQFFWVPEMGWLAPSLSSASAGPMVPYAFYLILYTQ